MTYTYKCGSCGKEFEIQCGIKQVQSEVPCLDCGSAASIQVSDATKFVLKGTGWYKDGYSKGTK